VIAASRTAIGFAQEKVGKQVDDIPQHDDAVCRRTALRCGSEIIERGRALGVLHDCDPLN